MYFAVQRSRTLCPNYKVLVHSAPTPITHLLQQGVHSPLYTVIKIIATFNIYNLLKLLYSVKDGGMNYLSSFPENPFVFKVTSLHRIYFSVSQQPNLGLSTLIFEVYLSSTDRNKNTHTHTRYDFSERVISLSKRPLPTQSTTTERLTSILSAGFEPAIPEMKRLQAKT